MGSQVIVALLVVLVAPYITLGDAAALQAENVTVSDASIWRGSNATLRNDSVAGQLGGAPASQLQEKIVTGRDAAPASSLRRLAFKFSSRTKPVLDSAGEGFSSKRGRVAHPGVIRAELVHRDHSSSPLRAVTSQPKSASERTVDSVRRSRNRRQHIARIINTDTSNSSTQSPVSSGDGEYLMQISLGTPAQTFTAIVDTGSDLVWVQCLPCQACYGQDGPKFNPERSETYKAMSCGDFFCTDLNLDSYSCTDNNHCRYEYGYGDKSTTSGDFVYDSITLGSSVSIPKFAFGCGHSNHGNFERVGGLVGLGLGTFSLPSQISSSIVADVFSYCLLGTDSSSTKTTPLFFGDAAPVAGVVYTPLIPNAANPTFYYVGLEGISLNGRRLPIPQDAFGIGRDGNGGLILDSGTTLTLLTEDAYDVVLEAFKAALDDYPTTDGSSLGLDLCYNLAGVDNPRLPTVVFHFAGSADYSAPAENLFVYSDQGETILCLAMASSGSSFSIIGNIMQQDHQLIYDRVHGRVGFASTNCDSL